ncbi:hypothetical protein SMGD1_1996 [Sulfurimonas gotlandica GD1]|uniref:Uncharacterized protein n=1 Tax=Sulfurimonas gotlandica (strain DSM 19862 / JCM 16533 / GD1) TaxID=929558 RepID=B6BJ05_SULGG|nr:hypothetical protein [Sulfurimonas gotlandica]EDZ63274.1 hypothetical protein CBGD1_893 [Sulfurimonas gotlandica GD1]EHP30519.1 hypothetical protein SMGD1_1996 [Sulfurimonas gotlandica GD1]
MSNNLNHYLGFEKEEKYMNIWDSIRYKKVDSIDKRVNQIISIFEKHVESTMLFNKDYTLIQALYRQMHQDTTFYMSSKAKDMICEVDPSYNSVFTRRKCVRTLKYIGETSGGLTYGKTYISKYFNGARYTIEKDDNGIESSCGSLYFEWIDLLPSTIEHVNSLSEKG